MLMQKIRHATQKHRTLLIVVVAVLAIGLVGSFAVMGFNDDSSNQGSESTTLEQIAYLEGLIDENLPTDEEVIDYDKASTLANLYTQLWTQYMQASSEAQTTDAEASLNYYEIALQAAAEAANYYQIQLDVAPDTLNDQAKGQIIARQAMLSSYAGEDEQAQELFAQALDLAPDNIEVAINYLNYLYFNQGFDAADDYAESYMSLVEADSTNYLQMEQSIEQMRMLEDLYDSLEAETAEGTDEATSEDVSAE